MDSNDNYFNLPTAPCFFPSPEEFRDPWVYLRSISPIIAKTGICIVQPPRNSLWDFDSFQKCIDSQNFSFNTNRQNVHQMQRRTGKNVSFFLDLEDFHKAVGTPIQEFPEVSSIPLDLFRLNNEITNRGGYAEVESSNDWASIALALRLCSVNDSTEFQSKIIQQLRTHYLRFLHPYNLAGGKVPEDLSEPPKKKLKTEHEVETQSTLVEPMWQQVKSRSFARDAKEECTNEQFKKHGGAIQGSGTILGGGMKAMGMSGMASAANKCLSGDREDSLLKNYGYHVGKSHTLSSFKTMADRFSQLWCHCSSGRYAMEEEYWRIIEQGQDWVQVQYGADLDVDTHGSGFPLNPDSKVKNHKRRAKAFQKRAQKMSSPPSDYMTKIGWNTNNLSEATFLHHIHESVGGITRPMLYVGMLFSSFCWHCEDNYLYSINYNHFGAPKLWYGVPGDASGKFEDAMRAHLPELFTKNPNLLYLLITQLSPRVLKEHGVPVYTAIQKPGQFVITCPRAYHAGFNTGFNCAESVNFALEDWLPICRLAVEQYRFHRSAVFPYEEFVLRAAREPDGARVALQLFHSLDGIIKQEQKHQQCLFDSGITQYIDMSDHVYRSCTLCGYDCYISGVVCNDHPNTIGCLTHAHEFCTCPSDRKRLIIRVHLSRLKEILEQLRASLFKQRSTYWPTHVEQTRVTQLPLQPLLNVNNSFPTPFQQTEGAATNTAIMIEDD